MRKAVWLSFDLGVKGDYESLYAWLDAHDAHECGDSTAFFEYETDGILPDEIKNSLKEAIDVDAKTRIYIVYKDDKKVKGRFLFGRRKSPPWSGYAPKETADTLDEDK